MRTVEAITFDDEPPGSVWHGAPPIVMDTKTLATYELAYSVYHIIDAVKVRQETGDITPLMNVITGIQQRAIASAVKR